MAKKRLFLLRHAKALSPEMDQSDAERALAPRGHTDAAELGAWLAEKYPELEHVYASSSTRTRESYAALSNAFAVSVSFEDQYYLASQGELLHAIHQLPDTQNEVMILGHNPGLHQLGLTLWNGELSDKITEDLLMYFPTCALLILEFEESEWGAIQPQSGKLNAYRTRHEAIEV